MPGPQPTRVHESAEILSQICKNLDIKHVFRVARAVNMEAINILENVNNITMSTRNEEGLVDLPRQREENGAVNLETFMLDMAIGQSTTVQLIRGVIEASKKTLQCLSLSFAYERFGGILNLKNLHFNSLKKIRLQNSNQILVLDRLQHLEEVSLVKCNLGKIPFVLNSSSLRIVRVIRCDLRGILKFSIVANRMELLQIEIGIDDVHVLHSCEMQLEISGMLDTFLYSGCILKNNLSFNGIRMVHLSIIADALPLTSFERDLYSFIGSLKSSITMRMDLETSQILSKSLGHKGPLHFLDMQELHVSNCPPEIQQFLIGFLRDGYIFNIALHQA
ncbi:hypothetical protein CCACVL1_15156 [Corchorus capsularis]|uniref:Uncharacterized protein n=1 Tax=Corchorus capsularis TaxID=210143 RepID=A0A1R3I3P9_COCAP|nr:hypothetical protein CCACVL1_15156 [Corchorus capsularis]